jgi:hypothetical protein
MRLSPSLDLVDEGVDELRAGQRRRSLNSAMLFSAAAVKITTTLLRSGRST